MIHTSKMFGVFHDAGYKGLYGGLGGETIKTRKNIPAKEQLLDRMNATELAANQFRMTQTHDKLARENISNQQQAILSAVKNCAFILIFHTTSPVNLGNLTCRRPIHRAIEL